MTKDVYYCLLDLKCLNPFIQIKVIVINSVENFMAIIIKICSPPRSFIRTLEPQLWRRSSGEFLDCCLQLRPELSRKVPSDFIAGRSAIQTGESW